MQSDSFKMVTFADCADDGCGECVDGDLCLTCDEGYELDIETNTCLGKEDLTTDTDYHSATLINEHALMHITILFRLCR